MIPFDYQPDSGNLNDKRKSNTKRFRLFDMCEIYLFVEGFYKSAQNKDREKKLLAAGAR